MPRAVITATAIAAALSVVGTPAAPQSYAGMPEYWIRQPQASVPHTERFAAVTDVVGADFTGDGLDDVLVTRARWPTAERFAVSLLVNDGRAATASDSSGRA